MVFMKHYTSATLVDKDGTRYPKYKFLMAIFAKGTYYIF